MTDFSNRNKPSQSSISDPNSLEISTLPIRLPIDPREIGKIRASQTTPATDTTPTVHALTTHAKELSDFFRPIPYTTEHARLFKQAEQRLEEVLNPDIREHLEELLKLEKKVGSENLVLSFKVNV
jgi:hypothetical protein